MSANSNHVSLYTNGIVHARKKIMNGKNGYGIKAQRRRVWVGEFFFDLLVRLVWLVDGRRCNADDIVKYLNYKKIILNVTVLKRGVCYNITLNRKGMTSL